MKPRPCKIVGKVCLVPLACGRTAFVDAKDFGIVSRRNWYTFSDHNIFYVHSYVSRTPFVTITLHRLIMGKPNSTINIIDSDGLNCRRSNLRFATQSQNQGNRRNQSGGTSPYRGVHRSRGKWRAMIRKLGRIVHLGMFDNEVEAAVAFDESALEFWGEFARLNFPEESRAT